MVGLGYTSGYTAPKSVPDVLPSRRLPKKSGDFWFAKSPLKRLREGRPVASTVND